MNFAVVYLGRKIPTYVFRNLSYLKSTFSDEKIYFVSDNQNALDRASLLGIETFRIRTSSEYAQKLSQNLTHPIGFRDGFWLHTTSRFFALLELSKFLNEPIIQIEADVFLFQNFPTSKFRNIDKIAFPLESPRTGAASIFYIPNLKAISEFVTFIFETTAQNSLETDMTLLGKYWIKNPNSVEILPSIPVLENLEENEIAASAASENLKTFKGLFDPLTYGMHLLGEDPLNSRGRVVFGKKPKDHLISQLALKFELRNGSLYLVQEQGLVEIFCLHVHSKNLKMFNTDIYGREIQEGIALASGTKVKISPRAFFHLGRKSILRRIKGKRNA